jgi:hypothetical protein
MVDERTIVSRIASIIKTLPDFDADVEEHIVKGIKRLDLIVRYNGKILFNGEFKRPTVLEGKSPRNSILIEDAYLKSNSLNPPAHFFITSNFNETIIWDNRDNSRPLMERDVADLILPKLIKQDEEFEFSEFKSLLEGQFKKIATQILDLEQNKIVAHYRELGESFVEGLNTHLKIAAETAIQYVPLNLLRKWWKEQNYEPKTDFGDKEKERMAKFSFYVLANKLVFYYVLKRTFTSLPEINVEDINDITAFKDIIDKSFKRAQIESNDFETVFEKSDADVIPFINEKLLYPVLSLIRFLQLYNFSNLSQDILGNLYDRLISPSERHENGQYYTPIPVVDLINALTIRDANARVLDPACGSGTFLIRAFDLKLKLKGIDSKEIREKIIEEIFGVDIASYPAHLATIALASKLMFPNPDVYPRIIRQDFLDIKFKEIIPVYRPKSTALNLKSRVVNFKPIDAVVSNLPYIKDEAIINKEGEQEKVKLMLVNSKFNGEFPSKGSDFHVYFWYYIVPFLKEGSRIGFLTSDTWLNVGYGDGLKRFINRYFKIIAIIDSSVERWFEDALVNTIITILERTNDEKAIKNNEIKLVRINKKISELIPDINSALKVANNILESKSDSYINIVRQIKQNEIIQEDLSKSKLYPYLRAPDEFFEIANNISMVPLIEIMDIKRGFTTGANAFFYVKDVTDNYSSIELKKKWGLTKNETKNLRIIRDGTGVDHVIEKEYLRPLLKGPREFTKEGKLNFDTKTKKYVVLIDEKDKDNIKPYALNYIKYGEQNPQGSPYSNTKTCSSRTPWWKLSPIIYPDIIFTMDFYSKYIFPKTNRLLDNRLYFGKEKKANASLAVYAFTNSTLFFLYPDFYGRISGGGAVEFKVYELEKIPVPRLGVLEPFYDDLKAIMGKMEKRKIGSVFDEIWDGNGIFKFEYVKPDRLELDRIILHAIGYKKPDEFLIKWYPLVINTIKERLAKAASVKTTKSSNRSANLSKVADDIIKQIPFKNFPDDYLKSYNKFKGLKIATDNNIGIGRDLMGNYVSIGKKKVYLDNKYDAKFVYYCAKRGLEKIKLPEDIADTQKILIEFEKDLRKWRNILNKNVEDITDDPKYKKKLTELCSNKINYTMLISE